MAIIQDCVLDIVSQVGGASPGLVTTYDKSRYHNDGTLTSATWVQLPSGLWVLTQNAATDSVNCGTDLSSHFTSQLFSGLIWVNSTDLSGSPILLLRTAAGIGWYFQILASGALRFLTTQVAASQITDGTAANVTTGRWQLLAFVRSATASVELYVDGVDDTASAAVHIDPDPAPAENLWIASYRGTSNAIIGSYARPRIYNYPLTPGQIRNYYEKTRYLFGV